MKRSKFTDSKVMLAANRVEASFGGPDLLDPGAQKDAPNS